MEGLPRMSHTPELCLHVAQPNASLKQMLPSRIPSGWQKPCFCALAVLHLTPLPADACHVTYKHLGQRVNVTCKRVENAYGHHLTPAHHAAVLVCSCCLDCCRIYCCLTGCCSCLDGCRGSSITQRLDPAKQTVVLCHHGVRSMNMSQFLIQQVSASFLTCASGKLRRIE
jgi:rhodanese-related sulfurtransferase